MPQRKQIITVRLPKMIVDELDRHVDGIAFRSRAHALHLILAEWLDKQRNMDKGKQTSILDLKPPKRGKERKK
jgi:Arc/MetJ-type ribon-helix-helix transcriptional regulator